MAKLKGCLWLIVAAFLVTAISPLAYADSSDDRQLVSTVTVQINLPTGKTLPVRIEDRIRDSIAKVANTILVGQDVSKIQESKTEITKVIETVFNKVLQGYEVLAVRMSVGERTHIILDLKPIGPVIEKVDFNLQLSGIDDKMIQVIHAETAGISHQAEEYLIGLPVGAFTWADDVVQPLLYAMIQEQFPGFTTTVNLSIGPEIKVDVSLLPKGERVKDLAVDITTHSLPQSLMYPLEAQVQKELELFRGMPLELLQKYHDRIVNEVEDAVQESKWGRYVYLRGKPQLVIGPKTELKLDIEWLDFELNFIGELNIGAEAPEPALHLGIGKQLGAYTTIRLQDRIALNKLKSTVSIGVDNYIGAGVTAQVYYEIREARWRTGIDWRHGKYGVSYTQFTPGEFKNGQLALNYYPLEHSKLALIYSEQRVWLSLMQAL